jgi:hypothetical protein
MKCPKCGCTKVVSLRKNLAIRNARGTLIRVAPQYRCIKCNAKWNVEGD